MSIFPICRYLPVFGIGIGASFLQGCSHGCTEIGCSDGFGIFVQAVDGSARPYEVALVIDGEEVTCQAPQIDEYTSGVCTDPRVAVSLSELADCEETRTKDSVSQSCTPNGEYGLSVSIQGTPQLVHVVLSSPDFPSVERTFTPKYSTYQPNGKGCPPQCKQAEESWRVE